jgi:ribosome-binding ATPase YchF (GTP1/OBG family)
MQAAGVIHTDFEKGFIRFAAPIALCEIAVEVFSWV